jgi:glycosyltransferase involved in cell wall biosynthesis
MYNEATSIDLFFTRLEPVLRKITDNYEIICVDDGSRDETLTMLFSNHIRDPRVKVVSLTRNFGKDIALSAGLDHATGQAVVPIDADLQDPPELISEMVEKWRNGYDVVYATRVKRDTDNVTKRITAGLFYRIHNWLADIRIPNNTGDFRLMDRRVVIAIGTLPERTRFMKGLFAWVGFKQTSVEYRREERSAGTTKWRYWSLWNFALDGITGSSTVLLRVWTYIGAVIALISLIYAAWLVFRTIIQGNEVPGYASLMVAILFLGAMNVAATGILGEYVGRIYNEVRNRPLYLVRETHGMPRYNQERDQWSVASITASKKSKQSTGGSGRAEAS